MSDELNATHCSSLPQPPNPQPPPTPMPATIHIESGISTGTSYWIDRPVLRVGSDPQCEICLPSAELAPHALTIEFRDGGYRLYNRAQAPVQLGGMSIQPGGLGDLRADQAIELPGGLRLVLKVDGDPRPCPRPAETFEVFQDAENAAPSGAADTPGEAVVKKSSNSLVQLAIIGFCVLGGVAFLTMSGGGETVALDRPTFEQLVEESFSADADTAARDRIQRLQYAQAALVRGNYELAKVRFAKLRDQLIREINSLPADQREQAERTLDYVEYRLSQAQ